MPRRDGHLRQLGQAEHGCARSLVEVTKPIYTLILERQLRRRGCGNWINAQDSEDRIPTAGYRQSDDVLEVMPMAKGVTQMAA